jgi:hypothetical protein
VLDKLEQPDRVDGDDGEEARQTSQEKQDKQPLQESSVFALTRTEIDLAKPASAVGPANDLLLVYDLIAASICLDNEQLHDQTTIRGKPHLILSQN